MEFSVYAISAFQFALLPSPVEQRVFCNTMYICRLMLTNLHHDNPAKEGWNTFCIVIVSILSNLVNHFNVVHHISTQRKYEVF